jgi:hypothetical protein
VCLLQSIRASHSEQQLPGSSRQPHAPGSAGGRPPGAAEAAAGPLQAGLPAAGHSFFPAHDEESGSDSGEDETAAAAARARRAQAHRFPRPVAADAAAMQAHMQQQPQRQPPGLPAQPAAATGSNGAMSSQVGTAAAAGPSGQAQPPVQPPASYFMPAQDRPSLLDLPMSLPTMPSATSFSPTANGLRPQHSLLDIDWGDLSTPTAEQQQHAAPFAPAALPLSQAAALHPTAVSVSSVEQQVCCCISFDSAAQCIWTRWRHVTEH